MAGMAETTKGQDKALYRRGLGHMQAGEWQKAIACFEELQQESPDSEDVKQLLEAAAFRAELDAEATFKPRRWAVRWRPIIAWTLAVLAAGAMTFQGVRFVRRDVIPGYMAAREARQQAQLLAEARAYLEQEEWEAAEKHFRLIKQGSPGYEEAQRALEEITDVRALASLYEEGVALQDEGDYAKALDVFREVLHRSPDYRDAAERIEQIEHRQRLGSLLAKADRAYERGDTLTALAAYERLRQLNISYEQDHVEARLFELYMQAGQEIVQGPHIDALPRATKYFVQALALRPSNPDAALEHKLAETCSQGLRAYDEEAWGKAIDRLSTVVAEHADYLDGEVTQSLYQAHIRLGEAYEEAGNLQLAHEQYQQALALPVDHTQVAHLIDSLVPRLTPTPSPTPTLTPIPTGTPSPTPRPFTGSTVQEDQNLLTNPSFETGWYDIYTGQVPDGWRFLWLDGVEFPGSADVALAPETLVTGKMSVPPEERSLLFRDGSRCLKVFRGFTPMYGAIVQDVSGLDVGRDYRLIVPIFVDVFNWEGEKIPPGGDAARVRLGAAPRGATWRDEDAIIYSDWWDGTNRSGFFLQYSDFTFDFEAEEPEMTIYIELAGIYGLSNNGFFLDDVALYPLGSSSGTPTPSD